MTGNSFKDNDMVVITAKNSKQRGTVGVIRQKAGNDNDEKYHVDNMYGLGNMLFPHYYHANQLELLKKAYSISDINSPCGTWLRWRKHTAKLPGN